MLYRSRNARPRLCPATAGRQHTTAMHDPVLDEHNAFYNYMLWHDSQGVRLPLHWRGSGTALVMNLQKYVTVFKDLNTSHSWTNFTQITFSGI